jgi:AcrR family transcriptional regulator
MLCDRTAFLVGCLAAGRATWQGVAVTATRRLGATDSKTRSLLIDAAQSLMLREGYAAVTSRRVAAEAGVKPQLVHYYFRSMDDLFLEVFRSQAQAGIDSFVHAMDVHRSLRTMWRFGTDLQGAAFSVEFVALANHRKAVRDEIALYASRFRELQLEAIAAILADHGVPAEQCPPVVVLLAMIGVTQIMALEEVLGVTGGHAEMKAYVEAWIDEAERDLTRGVAPRPPLPRPPAPPEA